MKVIPHRGCWNEFHEGNSVKALTEALQFFDGVEFDIRDDASDIILSHNPFTNNCISFDSFLKGLGRDERKKFFAINVKADGLGRKLKEILNRNEINNYMCFDLSFPEKRQYEKLGLQVFDRISDLEKNPEMESQGLIVDCFEKDIDLNDLQNISAELFFISPELHGRNYLEFWNKLRASKFNSIHNYICTDKPELIKRMFND